MDKVNLLDKIAALIQPLHPPVQTFETSIRQTPFRVLISVLLSSRTRDEITHKASAQLFAVADTPAKMAKLDPDEIARLIFPVGFYKQKTRHIKEIAQRLSVIPGEAVPQTLDALTALPGVGRKTANLVLSLAFNIPAIAVDIHVFRISQRLGWAKGNQPGIIEQQLKNTFPPEQWNRINQTLVGFGQTICKPVKPLCSQCTISSSCLYFRDPVETNKTTAKLH